MDFNETVSYLKKKGVKNPEDPSKDDMKKIFEILSNNDKEFNKDIYKEYSKTVNPSVNAVIDGMKSFASEHVSKEYILSVNKVIDQLNQDYANAKSEAEKDKIYSRIEKELNRIKQESNDQRGFIKTLLVYALGAAIVIGGVGLAITTKNTELLKKGLQVISDNRKMLS